MVRAILRGAPGKQLEGRGVGPHIRGMTSLNPHLVRYEEPPLPKLNGFSEATYRYIIEKAIDDGLTLRQAVMSEPGLPTTWALYAAAVRFPEVGAAMMRYRQGRAYALDQEIEDLADVLADWKGVELSANDIRRIEVATKSKEWLAAHRFPAIFGDRTNSAPTISIRIETNLPLGEEAGSIPGVFEVQAVGPVQEEQDEA